MAPMTLSGSPFEPQFGRANAQTAARPSMTSRIPTTAGGAIIASPHFGCSKMEGDSVQFSGNCGEPPNQ